MSFVARKPNRYRGYDYSSIAWYFVTICAKDRGNIFGTIEQNIVRISKVGQTILSVWQHIPDHFKTVSLDEYLVMPDHIHGIIVINRPFVGAGFPGPGKCTLGQIIGYFKYKSTKLINSMNISKFPGGKTPPLQQIWQRSFYDRIIRNNTELYEVRKYIRNNPMKID